MIRNKIAMTVLVMVTVIAGCGELTDEPSSDGIDMNKSNEDFDRLKRMPDIDHAVRRYREMQETITEQLARTIPELKRWEDTHDSVGRSGCLNGDGQEHNLSDQIVRVTLSDNRFNDALSVVQSVTKQFGFTENAKQLKRAEGKHFVSFRNPSDGSSVSFAANKRVVLQVRVGCHLTSESKKRGKPSES